MLSRTRRCIGCLKEMMSHISHGLLLIIGIIIISINSNMACEIGELRDLKLNVPFHKGLELTDEPTDPNINSHKTQIIVEPKPHPQNLLVTQPLNYSLSPILLTGLRRFIILRGCMSIRHAPVFHNSCKCCHLDTSFTLGQSLTRRPYDYVSLCTW